MNNVFIEILVILVLILVNGFFSMSEIAIVSARKTRLEQRADDGDKGAARALELSNATSKFLSSVQIGITLIALFTGALGGATLAGRLAKVLSNIPWLAGSAETISLIIVVLITTYVSLVIGELIPKKIALNDPEKIALNVSGVMHFVSKITAPLTKLLSASTDLGIRVLGVKPSDEPAITEEEIKVLIDQGTQIGVFGEAEQDMVEGIFRLNDRSINAIMTPRTEIVWLDANDDIDETLKIVLESPYSRFPVSRGSLDNVLGVLKSKTLMENLLSKKTFNITDLLEKPLFIPENTPAMRVLEIEREHSVHEALVIDEYGGVLGFVTLFDVLEAIIGELPSRDQQTEPEIVQRADGSYLIDGLLPIDEFKELLDLDLLFEEDKVGFQTAGGFVLNHIGAIPKSGEFFVWGDHRFEVIDMDGHRIDKILVSRVEIDSSSNSKETL